MYVSLFFLYHRFVYISLFLKADKTEFLNYFYRKSMCIILAPLVANTTGFRINREDYKVAQLQNLILDFLTFCVEHHTYQIKNYIINKNLTKRILVLLKSKHQFLALCMSIIYHLSLLSLTHSIFLFLAALRFLRKTIYSFRKDETYYKYIIKSNLFQPVVDSLMTNGSRYNILNSAIVELFDFIRVVIYIFRNIETDSVI